MTDISEDTEIVEAVVGEGIEALEGALDDLRQLESSPEELSPLDALFRCFHSVKGNCAMVGLTEPSEFAHKVEDTLSMILASQTAVTRIQVLLIQEAVDRLIGLLDGSQVDADSTQFGDERSDFLDRLHDNCAQIEDVATSVDPEDAQILEASMVSTSVEGAANDTRKGATPAAVDRAKSSTSKDESLRVPASSLTTLVSLAGDLFHLTARLDRMVSCTSSSRADHIRGELRELTTDYESTTNQLYERMLDIQKVGVVQLTRSLERIVREGCRKQGKWIEFNVEGQDLRIERKIIDQVRDSLVHMVRNSVDHGIESPEKRKAAGKKEQAHITLEITENDEVVSFILHDDGGGINVDAVRNKAIERGFVSAEEAPKLPDEKIIDFIYEAGFSTADQVTELSGRGVGMNVVIRDIVDAGGRLRTFSSRGEGTRIELHVPKAGSPVVEGLTVRVSRSTYLVPMKGIHKFYDWDDIEVIKSVAGIGNIAIVDGKNVPIIFIPGHEVSERLQSPVAVLVEDSQGRSCLVPVSAVLGHTRALVSRVVDDVRTLGRKAETFVLGDGDLGHVLDLDHLMVEKLG